MKSWAIAGLTLLLALTCATTLSAAPILVQSAQTLGVETGVGGATQQTLAVFAWTQTSTFTNVSISARLNGSDPTYQGRAYLMNAIGPGTTPAAQVVSATFTAAPPTFVFHDVTLFTGLTLGPDTYYLVLWAPLSSSVIAWSAATNADASFVRAPGVTGGAGFYVAQSPALPVPFAPNQTFFPFIDRSLTYAVVGTPVPEPATLMTLGFGVMCFAARARRKAKR